MLRNSGPHNDHRIASDPAGAQRAAERLSETFMLNLLSWVHPGFSVFAGPPVEAAALTSLESQARYITRPALAGRSCEARRLLEKLQEIAQKAYVAPTLLS